MVLFWASLCLSFSRVFIKSSLLDWVWFKFNPWQAPRFPRSSRLVVENRPLGRRSMYKWYSHGKWSNISRRAMFDYQTVYSQCCSLKTAFLASNPHCVPRITQALRAIVAGHYQHRVSTRLRAVVHCLSKKKEYGALAVKPPLMITRDIKGLCWPNCRASHPGDALRFWSRSADIGALIYKRGIEYPAIYYLQYMIICTINDGKSH